MRKLAILLLFATACTSTPTPQPEPVAPAETRPERSGGAVVIAPRGVSCNSAVVVDGANGRAAASEEKWIADNYPGAKVTKRSVADCNGKSADLLEIETANGQKRSIYFAPSM